MKNELLDYISISIGLSVHFSHDFKGIPIQFYSHAGSLKWMTITMHGKIMTRQSSLTFQRKTNNSFDVSYLSLKH